MYENIPERPVQSIWGNEFSIFLQYVAILSGAHLLKDQLQSMHNGVMVRIS